MPSQDVWVYSERNDVIFELLAKARQILSSTGGKAVSIIPGNSTSVSTDTHIQRGADSVMVLKHAELERFDSETYAEVVAQQASEKAPQVILVGSTRRGKELAARLGQRLQVPCLVDAVDLSVENGAIKGSRLLLGGKFLVKVEMIGRPVIASAAPRRFQPLEPDAQRKGEIIEIPVSPTQARVKIVQVGAKQAGGVKVEDASVIVSAGRGVRKKEDLAVLRELATTLGGELGCSRPIAEDLKWLPADHWIGLSGHKVKPKLYVAAGISGQIQHLAGMRESGVVVAINKDENAPIHQAADYSVVADLYQFVPALTQAVRKVVGKPA